MKTWNDLTKIEQEKAIGKALGILLYAIIEGSIKFSATVQFYIDTAIQEANDMQTPWFTSKYIMDAVGNTLRKMAKQDAKEAFYPDSTERIIRL